MFFFLTNNNFFHFLSVHPTRALEYRWEMAKDSWHIKCPYITILVQFLLPDSRAFVRCSVV